MVGITPARLMVLNKAAKLPSSMSAPLKSGEEGGNTLEDIVEVRFRSMACICMLPVSAGDLPSSTGVRPQCIAI